MAEQKHRTHFDITATDSATRVFKSVEASLTSLHGKYLAFGTAAVAAFGAGGAAAFIADATRYRAALDDLSDTTGDNIRTLDGMARQARVSGIELNRFGDLLTLVARNLNAADDEGNAAAQAIEAIGLSVQELRAMRPAEAMQAIATAMSQFADGQGKIAVANSLAKGSARELLPFLKDLAEEGGVIGKVTAEQAAQAEKLEKEWRKLKIAFDDGKDALVSSLIPALAQLVEQMRKGIEIAGGFGNALRLFGLGLSPGGDIGQDIRDKQAELDAWRAAGPIGRFFKKPLGATYAGTEADLQKQIEFLKFLQVQQFRETAPGGAMDMGVGLGDVFKGRLNFVPQKPGTPEKSPRLTDIQIAQMQAKGEEEFQEQITRWRKEQIEAEKKINEELTRQRDHYLDLIDPLRKFQKQWDELDELLRRGFLTQEQYLDAYVKIAEAADKARLEIEGLNEEAKKSRNAFAEMGFVATSALENIIIEGGKASDVLRALWQDLARIVLRKQVLGPLAEGIGAGLDKLFSGNSGKASTGDFSAGGGFEGVDWAGSFAGGGSFTVSGRGGTDSRLVAFRASPGERVDVSPPGQSAGGTVVVQQTNHFAVGIRGEVRAELAMQLPNIALAARGAVAEARERGGR